MLITLRWVLRSYLFLRKLLQVEFCEICKKSLSLIFSLSHVDDGLTALNHFHQIKATHLLDGCAA